MRKKIFAVFLSLAIAISGLNPVTAYAESNIPVVETENAEAVIAAEALEATSEDVPKAEFVTFPMFNNASVADDTEYKRRAVKDGIYMFSIYDIGLAVSVQNASKEDGASFILDGYNYKLSQQYEIMAVGDGWYKIINLYSGKALSIKGNSAKNRASIELRTYTEDDGQLWQFLETGDGDGCCYIKSKVGTMLNCTPGKLAAGNMLHAYELDGELLQRWKVEPAVDFTAAYITDGLFELVDYSTREKVVAPLGYTEKASAQMVLSTSLGHEGGQFYIEKYSDDWYRIINAQSGLVLTIQNGAYGELVKQSKWTGSDTQLWRFIDVGNGSFNIQSKAGTFLSRKDGGKTNGTPIQMSKRDLSSSQMWILKNVVGSNTISVQNGAEYLIESSLDSEYVMQVAGASTGGAANIQLGKENLAVSQRFRAVQVKENWYKLESVHSGLVVEIMDGSLSDGANVIQNPFMGTDSQLWRFVDCGDGYCYIQSKSGMILECANSKVAERTNLQVSEPEKSAVQKFKMCNISGSNHVRITRLTDYTARIVLYTSAEANIQSVTFPTWSVKNGQDDIIWFPGIEVEDGIWVAEIDTKGMNAEDWFDLYTHVYINIDGKNNLVGNVEYTLKARLEGWVYIDGLRRYRLEDGSIMNDVSEIFNPSSKYITVDRIKGITTIYGYNSQTNAYDTPIKAMWCSVGNPISLTEAGTYSMGWQLKSKEMNASDGSYRCWASYVSQIYGPVYFHGVASDTPDLNTISAAAFRNLGNPASHGCVRLAAIDARWIYYNTSKGTQIKIGDNLASPMVPKRYQWVGGSVGPDPTYIP